MFQGTTEDAGQSRPAMVAFIMLGIFLLSVGIAWWISIDREQLVREGDRIVGQIQSSKLESFWHRGEQSYYLIREKQGTVGWRAELRIPRQGGGFDGLLMQVISSGNQPQVHIRKWQLDTTATNGWFQVAWLEGTEPRIILNKGYLIEQVSPNPGKVEVPPNFLPEGTLSLAARLVAQAKGQAFFRSAYINDSGPREIEGPQTVNVGLTNLIYKGQEMVQENGKAIQANVVEVRLGILGKERTETLYLAPDGHTVLITRPGQTITPTTLGELVQIDPSALRMIQQEAFNSGFDLNALKTAPRTSAKTNPPEEQNQE